MTSNSNKRIIKNTLVLYLRVILSLFLTLFSARFVLQGLGESNYGLYNLIAGVVGLFSFISGTMAATSQRFISYEMGASKDILHVRRVFSTSVTLHVIIVVIVTFIVIIGGLYLIEKVLTIPPSSLKVAKFVLYCVAIGLIGTILSVPYEAALMARENIVFFLLHIY